MDLAALRQLWRKDTSAGSACAPSHRSLLTLNSGSSLEPAFGLRSLHSATCVLILRLPVSPLGYQHGSRNTGYFGTASTYAVQNRWWWARIVVRTHPALPLRIWCGMTPAAACSLSAMQLANAFVVTSCAAACRHMYICATSVQADCIARTRATHC